MTRGRRLERRYAVRGSPIHGKGVFALRPIQRGDVIVEYRGERVSSEEAARRYQRSRGYPFTYLFEVDEDTVIDAAVGGNAARFINHACSPNCEAVDDDGRILIQARRDIAPGEELTYDYRLEVDERVTQRLRKLFACNCGSRRCRGTLLKPD
jgi:hypothetical protein